MNLADIQERIQKARRFGGTTITVSITDMEEIIEQLRDPLAYNPTFGDDKLCECGHPYHRHFDSYEDMEPVGCKYCDCETFAEKT